MKICLINNLYPPYARGGAEQVVRKTIERLIQDGHHVVLVTTSPEGEYSWHEGNLTIYRFRPWNLFFYTQGYRYHWLARLVWHGINLFHISAAAYTKEIIQKEQPDVVHTHNLMGISFLIPRMIRKLGVRHLHHVHDVQLVEPSGIILKQHEQSFRYTGWPTKIYTVIVRKLMGSPDVVISPSKFLLNFYQKRGFFKQSKQVVLRNPLTVPMQTQRHKHDQTVFRFLYLGQIEEHKGVQIAIDAFLALGKSLPIRCELAIVGGGSLLEKIKEKTKTNDNIRVYGKVGREELPALFHDANMTIVPSLCYENSPTVIFESFAFGVPVLASNIEGVAELIDENKNGQTFEAGNKQTLKEKMLWALNHKDNVYDMGIKAQSSLKQIAEVSYIDVLVGLYGE